MIYYLVTILKLLIKLLNKKYNIIVTHINYLNNINDNREKIKHILYVICLSSCFY